MKRLLLLLLTLLSACNSADNEVEVKAPLVIHPKVEWATSKGLVGETFSEGESIGITFADAGYTTYDGTAYANLPFTLSNSGWHFGSGAGIYLSATSGFMQAYYPYKVGVNAAAIPVTAGQTDYMYAEWSEAVNNNRPSVTLLMKHALGAIRLLLKRGDYSGRGQISSITVQGDCIGNSGMLDSTTGTLTVESSGEELINNELQALPNETTTTITNEWLVLPNANTSTITVKVHIDNKTFQIVLPSIQLQRANVHKYTVAVNNLDLDVTNITVDMESWNNLTEGEHTVKTPE